MCFEVDPEVIPEAPPEENPACKVALGVPMEGTVPVTTLGPEQTVGVDREGFVGTAPVASDEAPVGCLREEWPVSRVTFSIVPSYLSNAVTRAVLIGDPSSLVGGGPVGAARGGTVTEFIDVITTRPVGRRGTTKSGDF